MIPGSSTRPSNNAAYAGHESFIVELDLTAMIRYIEAELATGPKIFYPTKHQKLKVSTLYFEYLAVSAGKLCSIIDTSEDNGKLIHADSLYQIKHRESPKMRYKWCVEKKKWKRLVDRRSYEWEREWRASSKRVEYNDNGYIEFDEATRTSMGQTFRLSKPGEKIHKWLVSVRNMTYAEVCKENIEQEQSLRRVAETRLQPMQYEVSSTFSAPKYARSEVYCTEWAQKRRLGSSELKPSDSASNTGLNTKASFAEQGWDDILDEGWEKPVVKFAVASTWEEGLDDRYLK